MMATTASSTLNNPIASSKAALNDSHHIFSIEGKTLKLSTADDVAEFVAKIKEMGANLTEIRLSGNTVGVDAARALAEAIKVSSVNLKIASFSDMFTGRLREEIPPALDAFVDAFVDKTHLHTVDLSDNAFGPAGATPLTRLVLENTNIHTLKLNNTGLGAAGAEILSKALIDSATAYSAANPSTTTTATTTTATTASLPTLRVLILGRNRLQCEGALHIAKCLPYLSHLEELRMPMNSIRQDGMPGLLASLSHATHLRLLDLEDNTLTQVGADALLKVLPVWEPTLEFLNVGDCLLGSEGSKKIVTALASGFEKLQSLVLTYNEMDGVGAKMVPGMLRNKKALKELKLNGNAFDPESDVVEQIKDQLRVNGFVDALDELDEMDFDEDEEKEDEDDDDDDKNDDDADVDELTAAMDSKIKM